MSADEQMKPYFCKSAQAVSRCGRRTPEGVRNPLGEQETLVSIQKVPVHLFNIIGAAGAQAVIISVPNIFAHASLQADRHASLLSLLCNVFLLQDARHINAKLLGHNTARVVG